MEKIINLITIESLLNTFFYMIGFDLVTAIIVAAKNGKIRSRKFSDGIFRTMGECIVLSIIICLYKLIPTLSSLLWVLIIAFIFKEGISIIENLIKLDVWIPDSIKKMLEVGVEQVNSKQIK